MANFRVEVKSGRKGRAAGHSRYISRSQVLQAGDLLFSTAANLPSFADGDPTKLWAAADRFERANGSTYREYVVNLPAELHDAANVELAMELVDLVAGDLPYQLAVHKAQGAISAKEHPHLHLMVSERIPDGIERTAKEYFRRANTTHPERGGARKQSGGRTPTEMALELLAKKAKIATTTNLVLARYGRKERVDHRSNRERGIDKPTEIRLPAWKVAKLSGADKARIQQNRASL